VPDSNTPEIDPLTRPQVLAVMGMTAVLLLAVTKAWQALDSPALLPWRASAPALGLGLALALAIAGASSLLYRWWPAYRRSARAYLTLVLEPLVWPDLIWLGLLPGLSEELLFRGLMLPALGGDAAAVAVTSLLFGSLHLGGIQQWPYVVWATCVGALLGTAAVLSGNLLVPIVAHVTTNWISSALWKLNR